MFKIYYYLPPYYIFISSHYYIFFTENFLHYIPPGDFSPNIIPVFSTEKYLYINSRRSIFPPKTKIICAIYIRGKSYVHMGWHSWHSWLYLGWRDTWYVITFCCCWEIANRTMTKLETLALLLKRLDRCECSGGEQ